MGDMRRVRELGRGLCSRSGSMGLVVVVEVVVVVVVAVVVMVVV